MNGALRNGRAPKAHDKEQKAPPQGAFALIMRLENTGSNTK